MSGKTPKRNRVKSSAAARAADTLAHHGLPKIPPKDPVYKIPERMTEEELTLLEEARAVIDGVETKMIALMRAASERWKPEQSILDTAETDPPVFGDEEYDDFAEVVNMMAEATLVKAIGKVFNVPDGTLDSLVHERLKLHLLPPPVQPKTSGMPFSMRRHGQRTQE